MGYAEVEMRLDKTVHVSASTSTEFTVSETPNFDPIDLSISKNHGYSINFTDGSRAVFRLSIEGDTVRMYAERYDSTAADAAELDKPAAEMLHSKSASSKGSWVGTSLQLSL